MNNDDEDEGHQRPYRSDKRADTNETNKQSTAGSGKVQLTVTSSTPTSGVCTTISAPISVSARNSLSNSVPKFQRLNLEDDMDDSDIMLGVSGLPGPSNDHRFDEISADDMAERPSTSRVRKTHSNVEMGNNNGNNTNNNNNHSNNNSNNNHNNNGTNNNSNPRATSGGVSPCPAPCDPDITDNSGNNGFMYHGFLDPRLPSPDTPSSQASTSFRPTSSRRPVPIQSNHLQLATAMQQGSTPAISGAKHLQTEQVMSKHSYKSRLNRYQELIEQAFALICRDGTQTQEEGLHQLCRLMDRAWCTPRIGHDLSYALCDYLRDSGHMLRLVTLYLDDNLDDTLRLPVARALENSLSSFTRSWCAYLVQSGYLMPLMMVALTKYNGSSEMVAAGVSLMENMFKHSSDTSRKMIDAGVLDYIINTFKSSCKQSDESAAADTLRHAALAILNLTMHSDAECQQIMISKNVPDWLYILASHRDDIICYYACLATVMLASNKELGSAVKRSGTLTLVEPFLHSHRPEIFVNADHKIARGRPRDWLQKMVSLLTSRLKEAKGLAAFHFSMEAIVKKQHDRLEVFMEIGAVDALKEVASSPYEIAAKLASQALTVIGETVPYKLSQQVPLWSVQDVRYWVTKIGFEQYATVFTDQKVDGDLLLLMTDEELLLDIGMKSGLLRKRFLRELEGLKIAADYSSVDPSELDSFMLSVSERMSKYTYQMLDMGVDRSLLPNLTNDILASTCGMANPIHRIRLLQALQDCKSIDDMEINMLSKQIDIFISYRRRSGNQLASLIKVLLQLRGYKVFIDVDRLYAGQFDSSLLKNIMAAKTFILVLTEHSLDRWIGDDGVADWVHKEVRCALDNHKNIVPIFDVNFDFPDDAQLPADVRVITRLNGIKWIHEYQDACIDKLEKFLHPPVTQPSNVPITNNTPTMAMRRSISVIPTANVVSFSSPRRNLTTVKLDHGFATSAQMYNNASLGLGSASTSSPISSDMLGTMENGGINGWHNGNPYDTPHVTKFH